MTVGRDGESSKPSGGAAVCPGAWLEASLSAADVPCAVVRKLNELYKASVLSCQGLSLRLQRFFLDKQRLLDRIQSVTAEKLIFSHAVHTVWSDRSAGGGMWDHAVPSHRWPGAPPGPAGSMARAHPWPQPP